MSEDGKKSFFATVPGILSGVAALIVALTTLYFGLKDRSQPPQPPSQTDSRPLGPASNEPNAASLEAQRQGAERLAADWLAAMRIHDVAQLVRLAETPYYFDKEILVSRESIADKYNDLFKTSPTFLQDVEIQSIRARTIAEMKQEGQDLRRDRLFNSLSLSDSDWGIEVRCRMVGKEDCMKMFARNVAGNLRIVGMWN